MRTMKIAYMLRSEKYPKRYLLREIDPVWETSRLSTSEQINTYGQQFICETDPARAKEIADRHNSKAGPDDQVVVVKVLRGFVPWQPKMKKNDFVSLPHGVANDLVWRCDVYRMLHEIGGTGAEENSWADGWDKAVDTAVENLENMEGAY